MNKKNYFYIAIGLLFLTLISNITTSLAWNNGKHTVGTGYQEVRVDPIPLYESDYKKSISANTRREYYGTHDWIAESALELLYNHRSDNQFLSKLWDINNPDKLRIYLLYATEFPDITYAPSRFSTKCGYYFNTFQRPQAHNQLYFLNGLIINDRAAQAANIYYQGIKKAFQEKDCQKAAGLIGAMMHVIADATLFNHVIAGTRKSNEFGKHVDYVAYKTWNDGDRKQQTGVTEFFDINEARTKLQTN